jgi:hypothetical protein
MKVEFHPSTAADVNEAAAWYGPMRRRSGGASFTGSLTRCCTAYLIQTACASSSSGIIAAIRGSGSGDRGSPDWIRSDNPCLMNLRLLNTSSRNSSQTQALVAGARELGRRLRQYSQENMAAGWLMDLEFMAWQDLVDHRLTDDLLVNLEGGVLPPLAESEKAELRQLSEAIEGWVSYDAEDEEDRLEFVPLRVWEARFEDWLVRAQVALQNADPRGEAFGEG